MLPATLIIPKSIVAEFEATYKMPISNARFYAVVGSERNDERAFDLQDRSDMPYHMYGWLKALDEISIIADKKTE